jgi:UDP-2-acetamido-2,6-beta-L-arabino-hexul-4-ose reductase
MGTHLFNYLGLKKDVERIPFADDYFSSRETLDDFVKQCDVIVHLAAMNRHGNPQVIYDTNLSLVKNLLESCERTNSKPHILFSSSTQEERDNLYGKSKLEGRLLFEKWAEENNTDFTALIIPNVFGPFGNPYYNSVIATFSHQLTHDGEPRIEIDGELKLIYINELVEEFWNKIEEISGIVEKGNGEKVKEVSGRMEEGERGKVERYEVPFTYEIKVSEILSLLKHYKELYFEKGIIPQLNNKFELNLFNTFRSYFPNEKFPFLLKENIDERGSFVEIIRTNTSGQYSYSTTKPGITRGNHFHTRKIERFAVIHGKAKIELRRIGTEEVIPYYLDGENPSFVDMPIWTTHNITNIGDTDLYTLFWINEPYDAEDPDTYFEGV